MYCHRPPATGTFVLKMTSIDVGCSMANRLPAEPGDSGAGASAQQQGTRPRQQPHEAQEYDELPPRLSGAGGGASARKLLLPLDLPGV